MRRFNVFIFFFFLLFANSNQAQTIFDWVNTSDGNFSGGVVNRWYDNVLLTNLQSEPVGGGIILRFNNNNQITTNNNVTGTYSIYQLLFGSLNTLARTINGNPIRFTNYLGVSPRIENQSSGTHNLSMPIEGDGNPVYPLEINPVSGNLSISGTINNQGSPIQVLGGSGRTLTITGVISGSGDFELKQNTSVILSGSNSFTGKTTISAGVLFANNSVIASSNGAFGNHSSGIFLNGGTLFSNTSTFSRPLTISATNSVIDAYGQSRVISSSISMPSGTMNLNIGGNYAANQTGQDLTLSGTISSASGILSLTKIGNSKVILSGANTFNGPIIVQGGTLTLNNPASLPTSCAIQLAGGSLQAGAVSNGAVLSAGTLTMISSSTIDMGTGTNPFSFLFADSGPTFTGMLTIQNWSATNGKKIRFSSIAHIQTVLSQIQFIGYPSGAQILNGDELWPSGIYFTQASGIGNFSDATAWIGGTVPPSNSNVYVQSGFTLSLDGSYTLRSVEVAGVFNCSSNYSLTLGSTNNKISNSGFFNFTNGSVIFNSNGGVVDGLNGYTFNNLTLNGSVIFYKTSTINGTLQLNAGSGFSGVSPTYGTSSTLIYNTGGLFYRNAEWNSGSGAGYPKNVLITNSTEVRFDWYPISTDFGCSGNLTIDAGAHLNMKTSFLRLRIVGNLNINGQLSLSGGISPGAFLYLSGDWNRASTGSVDFNTAPNTRTVEFFGGTNTFITGPSGQIEYFPYIRMNKTSYNNTVTLNNPVHILSGLTLSYGIIVTSMTNILSIGNLAAPATTGSVQSFISGPMKKMGQNWPTGNSFTFPIGKKIGSEVHYRPLTISPPTNSSHEYIAEFQRSDPHAINGNSPISNAAKTALPKGLSHISYCEYWDLTKSVGASNVDVTLSWSSNSLGKSQCNTSAYVNDFTNLVVVPYYNGEWGDQNSQYFGRTSTSGTNSDGTITWTGSEIDNYQHFTLGSTDWRYNPLPFTLISFNGLLQKETIQLNWTAIRNDQDQEYRIEHSSNGYDFSPIGIFSSQNSSSQTSYSFYHSTPVFGWNYYRIIAIDYQDQPYISQTIRIWFDNRKGTPFIYPNPVSGDQFYFHSGLLPKGFCQLKISGSDGSLIKEQKIYLNNAQQIFSVSLPSNLPAGVYWLSVVCEKHDPVYLKIVK